jgi:hypothetical protein
MEPSSLPGAYLTGAVQERLRPRVTIGEPFDGGPRLEDSQDPDDGFCNTNLCKSTGVPCGPTGPSNPPSTKELPCAPSLNPPC